MAAKYKALQIFLLLWFISRFVFVIFCQLADVTLFMLEEEHFRNSSETISNNTLTCMQAKLQPYAPGRVGYIFIAYLYVHSITQLAYDMFEHYELFFKAEHQWMGKTPKGRKRPVTHVFFYRITQTLLYITIIATLTCRLLRVHSGFNIPLEFDNFVSTFISFLITWSMMQFVQLLPSIGHFTVALQRLLANLVSCLFVFGLMTFAFADIFFTLSIKTIFNVLNNSITTVGITFIQHFLC